MLRPFAELTIGAEFECQPNFGFGQARQSLGAEFKLQNLNGDPLPRVLGHVNTVLRKLIRAGCLRPPSSESCWRPEPSCVYEFRMQSLACCLDIVVRLDKMTIHDDDTDWIVKSL